MGRIGREKGTASCEVCGNDQGEIFEIRLGGERHTFDSFECAMRAFSPLCENCGSQIIGHGVISSKKIYCSYQCVHEGLKEYDPGTQVNDQVNF